MGGELSEPLLPIKRKDDLLPIKRKDGVVPQRKPNLSFFVQAFLFEQAKLPAI